MTLAEMRTEIRDITNTNTTSFTDTDIDRKINIEHKHLTGLITQAARGSNRAIKQKYTNLVKADGLAIGDIGYNGEYPLPSDCVIPLRIEVEYDDTQRPMTAYDQASNPYSEFIEGDMDGMINKIRFTRGSYFIRKLPTQDVTGGIYVEYVGVPTDLSADADVPFFNELFHDVLVLAVADRRAMKKPDKYNSKIEDEYRIRKAEMLDIMSDMYPERLNVNAYKENFN